MARHLRSGGLVAKTSGVCMSLLATSPTRGAHVHWFHFISPGASPPRLLRGGIPAKLWRLGGERGHASATLASRWVFAGETKRNRKGRGRWVGGEELWVGSQPSFSSLFASFRAQVEGGADEEGSKNEKKEEEEGKAKQVGKGGGRKPQHPGFPCGPPPWY